MTTYFYKLMQSIINVNVSILNIIASISKINASKYNIT